MILATGAIAVAGANYCATQPELPVCVEYAARLAAEGPWLRGFVVVEIVAFAAFVIAYRIKTGNWRPPA